ncbi:hypothetical protein D9758_013162 [Tetrapyrgos nigripes]|uniref:Uncharacterized protein n=1 Tax=Tetrapyrgos nigripes TaxID=182062 RepID=A0A8H5CE56_9AGAR|nr:hypothetical protein D9758_013162 [Tetrapyrgos nigripes]
MSQLCTDSNAIKLVQEHASDEEPGDAESLSNVVKEQPRASPVAGQGPRTARTPPARTTSVADANSSSKSFPTPGLLLPRPSTPTQSPRVRRPYVQILPRLPRPQATPLDVKVGSQRPTKPPTEHGKSGPNTHRGIHNEEQPGSQAQATAAGVLDGKETSLSRRGTVSRNVEASGGSVITIPPLKLFPSQESQRVLLTEDDQEGWVHCSLGSPSIKELEVRNNLELQDMFNPVGHPDTGNGNSKGRKPESEEPRFVLDHKLKPSAEGLFGQDWKEEKTWEMPFYIPGPKDDLKSEKSSSSPVATLSSADASASASAVVVIDAAAGNSE